jgi:hypothetical protein
MAAAGVGVVEPDGHAYPALQLVHDGSPAILYFPAGQIAAAGVAVVEPDGHA